MILWWNGKVFTKKYKEIENIIIKKEEEVKSWVKELKKRVKMVKKSYVGQWKIGQQGIFRERL